MPTRKVLVLGSGGREHALCWHLKNQKIDVECAPGSDAIQALCPIFGFKDFNELEKSVRSKGFTEIIVGPEKYLAEGIADFFAPKGISIFGPTKAAAQLETDKAWAKDFLLKHKISTAKSRTISKVGELAGALKEFSSPYVIKAAGLAAGKGVWIGDDETEGLAFASAQLEQHSSVVIEDFLPGEEVSFFVLIDGDKHLFLGAAQDHKRLLENDLGPNTGGMGAYSPVPILDDELQKRVEARIIIPTIEGLKKDGIHYRGFLFVGLMVVRGEPYVLEFNCRMGDPETQSLMMRLDSNLLDLIESLKTPTPIKTKHKPGVSLNVVVAAKGYPDKPENGFKLEGIDQFPPALTLFHSGTRKMGKDWLATGGRLFSVTTIQESLFDCQNAIYPSIENLKFQDKITYRKDIGVKAYRHLIQDSAKSKYA